MLRGMLKSRAMNQVASRHHRVLNMLHMSSLGRQGSRRLGCRRDRRLQWHCSGLGNCLRIHRIGQLGREVMRRTRRPGSQTKT